MNGKEEEKKKKVIYFPAGARMTEKGGTGGLAKRENNLKAIKSGDLY